MMSSKTQEEYVSVLRQIQQTVPHFQPTLVMTDYEQAMQNAWEYVYNTRVVGCYWHYCRVSKNVYCLKALTFYCCPCCHLVTECFGFHRL